MIPKEFVQYQNKLYWVYRKVKQHQVKEGLVSDLRDFWMCDVVVKSRNQNDEILLFMREVEDAIIVS
jgi:hypothetical protein